MKHRSFSIVSILWLLLLVATVGLWLRSYRVRDIIGFQTQQTTLAVIDSHFHGVTWSCGNIGLGLRNGYQITHPLYLKDWLAQGPPARFIHQTAQPTRRLPGYVTPSGVFHISGLQSQSGFGWNFSQAMAAGLTIDVAQIGFPFWALALLLAIAPGARLVALVTRQRRFRGRCTTCRYDLTGNTSGVCPECGTAIGKNQNRMAGQRERFTGDPA